MVPLSLNIKQTSAPLVNCIVTIIHDYIIAILRKDMQVQPQRKDLGESDHLQNIRFSYSCLRQHYMVKTTTLRSRRKKHR